MIKRKKDSGNLESKSYYQKKPALVIDNIKKATSADLTPSQIGSDESPNVIETDHSALIRQESLQSIDNEADLSDGVNEAYS